MRIEIENKGPLKGELVVPPDKSISHRTIMLGGLAHGVSLVRNLLRSADVLSTIRCMRALGVEIIDHGEVIEVVGNGWEGLQEPDDVLDCGNSGTTMRLMSGIAAAHDFQTVLTGDDSLRQRPMKRVIEPLTMMGAIISGRDGGRYAPLVVKGGHLQSIEYQLPVASAQVKSAILLAALGAKGKTTVVEKVPARDHTERMLAEMGAAVIMSPGRIDIEGYSDLAPQEWLVPGDISSAAFFLTAASIVPESQILLKNVGMNPTRTGVIQVLLEMGADIKMQNQRIVGGEPLADILVTASQLRPVEIKGDIIPRLIDEIPVLAIAMAAVDGVSSVRDAEELRAKETDRIAMITSSLNVLGVKTEETGDGFTVYGTGRIKGGCEISSGGDHRIAMAASVAGLISQGPVTINGFSCVNISYPGFLADLNSLQ